MGLMDYIKALMMQQQQSPAPQVDEYGIQLPGAGREPTGQEQHTGGMMGGRPMMDPNQMQMILRMMGR